ncbi:SGNH/GDSL hydrolase family protein [Streptococcus catagoni]|uniref:SGNH/GDSL hydrolase family protein n=1 Tax=Streptococcus catagoni TaxID=2654874 RepID=UPI00140CBFE9|nr:SGNH/GDSL hydrolase family protein [Streptococcus catagoni]
MNKRKWFEGFAFFLGVFLLSALVLQVIIPQRTAQVKKADYILQEKAKWNYIAIGDSLTEGVGDSTSQGGFVPLLASDMEEDLAVKVDYQNYGVSGNTSQQIYSRMTEDEQLQTDLKKAKIMTLTVGGNDVMAVIRENFAHLESASFKMPAKAYQKRLRKILDLAKKENKKLSIFVLGIYNPFYLNFPEMTEMQEVVDRWNRATKDVISDYQGVYFVSINDQLYKGIDGKNALVQSEADKTSVVNDLLFKDDHFHPNNIGYRIMSDALMERIKKYEKTIKN